MSWPDLDSFQDWFGRAVATGEAPDGPPIDPSFRPALAVHRNTTAKAACDALADNYPVVRQLCGDESFFGLAAAFVRRQPAMEPRLNAYGDGFELFLRRHDALQEAPYIADVAGVERMATEALFAPDASPLSMPAAEALLRSGGRLRLHPAARFRQFASPAGGIWRAGQMHDGEGLDALAWVEDAVLVTRPDAAVRVTLVDTGALAFLRACGEGASLTAALETALAARADLAHLLPSLVAAGAFI